MGIKLTQLLGCAAAMALVMAPTATAAPGQDGAGCIPFLGCGSWDYGSGGGCINGLGCASGNPGDLSGCVVGIGCRSYRP